MQNSVINQIGFYTSSKFVNSSSLQILLKTKDKSEAMRIIDNIKPILDIANINNPETVKALVYASLNKLQPAFEKERLVTV